MMDMNRATPTPHESGFGKDKATRAKADDLLSCISRQTKEVESFGRNPVHGRQEAADNSDVVIATGIRQRSPRQDLQAATGTDGFVCRRQARPAAIDLPTLVCLVCGMSHGVDETGKGKQREIG